MSAFTISRGLLFSNVSSTYNACIRLVGRIYRGANVSAHWVENIYEVAFLFIKYYFRKYLSPF